MLKFNLGIFNFWLIKSKGNRMLVDTLLHEKMKTAVNAGERNPWVYGKFTDFYFRNTRRMINGEIYPSIDVSNISVKPKYKSKGVFKSLMDFIEEEYRHRLIYVENILEPRLIEFFIKRGYSRVDKGDYDPAPSFYRLPK
jgi:GNAT superfamily N-acetyltransferase